MKDCAGCEHTGCASNQNSGIPLDRKVQHILGAVEASLQNLDWTGLKMVRARWTCEVEDVCDFLDVWERISHIMPV